MAAEISAQLVRELREQTGAGMMDCKRALQETNGDIAAAIVLLREKNLANAAKREGRETTEGLVGYRVAEDGLRGTMVAIGCETEHISWSDPRWIAREDVPEELVTAEREIFANGDEVQSKPEQAREKIVDGMLNKRFFGVNVLAEQEWIHDSSQTVGKVLADAGAEVLEFQRFSLAG